MNLMHGDCLEVLRTLSDNSVDSVVTDPPYGLSFMGKKWDYDVPSVEIWAECLRVLKPGGHLLAFAGTRTQHRMAVRIEDAGFEIRDMIAWVYGSGFPKSMDVSKAIDKAAGAERPVVGTTRKSIASMQPGHGNFSDDNFAWKEEFERTGPATPEAAEWQGWGTALKPALEPITVARKPFTTTVAANVLAHGTGALNIDACRVETSDNLNGGAYAEEGKREVSGSLSPTGMNVPGKTTGKEFQQPSGRWPANLIHDGSEEVTSLFPVTTSGAMKVGTKRAAQDEPGSVCYGTYGGNATSVPIESSSGNASRFFYCAKANKRDRGNANDHPTVKPTDLMAYLCRLVTPPGGIVLDPFMGSGSTGKGALRGGFQFIGIERDEKYFAIAKKRIEDALYGDLV